MADKKHEDHMREAHPNRANAQANSAKLPPPSQAFFFARGLRRTRLLLFFFWGDVLLLSFLQGLGLFSVSRYSREPLPNPQTKAPKPICSDPKHLLFRYLINKWWHSLNKSCEV
jgi:hypothetical protein